MKMVFFIVIFLNFSLKLLITQKGTAKFLIFLQNVKKNYICLYFRKFLSKIVMTHEHYL